MKNRLLVIDFPVFGNYLVHVEITNDFKKTAQKFPLTQSLAEDADEEADALTFTDDAHIAFVFLKPNVTVGTIAHESWHVVQHMMEHFGADLDGEIVAYHLGYLVDKIFKFLRHKSKN